MAPAVLPVARGEFDDPAVVEEGGVAVAGGGGLPGVRQGLLVAPVHVQGPGEGVRGVHGVPARPLGAGGAQGGGLVAVVGGGECGVEVGVDAVGPGEGRPGVHERVLVLGLRLVAVGAPVLVQLPESDERPGQRIPGHDGLHALDRGGAVPARGLGTGPALQSGKVGVVGGEGAGVVGQGRVVVALVPGELAQRAGHVGDVARSGRGGQGPLQDRAGGTDVAAELVDVRVAGEHRDAGPSFVGEVCGLRRLVVAAEFDEGVDPGGQGAFVVGILLEGLVGVLQRALEVVPGRGERGETGEPLLVVGLQLQRLPERLLRLRIPRGITLGPRLLDVGESEGGPAAEVPRLAAEMGLQRLDARVEVPAGHEAGESAADVLATVVVAPSRSAPKAIDPPVSATANRAAHPAS